MRHPREDDLALLALGEPVAGVSEHVRACPDCERELLALTATVDTARRADLTELPPPPPAVWHRIADELGLPETAPPRRTPLRSTGPRPSPWRRPLLVGAGVLAAAAAATGVFAALPGAEPAPPRTAPLVALGTVDASGRVVLSAEPDARSLLVDTSGLPDADGSYEVWLLDLERDRLVALGALDDTGRGRLTVPDDVRLGDYPEIDVSLEPDDGDPGHSGESVLRGSLPA